MTSLQFITLSCNGPDTLDSAVVERPDDGPDLLFNDHPSGAKTDLLIHLDLSAGDRERTVERLCDLGATGRETKTEEYETHTSTWTVLEDSEGNGFCVSEYP